MRSVELAIDGPIDQQGGVKDKMGIKRGPYKVGRDSERTLQRNGPKFVHSCQLMESSTHC